jgi:hypothetical protein
MTLALDALDVENRRSVTARSSETKAAIASQRKARSSLVRRLVQAQHGPAKQRIRRWLSKINNERLLSFGLTPEDIALLRGSRSAGKFVSTVLSELAREKPDDSAITLPKLNIAAVYELLGGFDGGSIVPAVEFDGFFKLAVAANDIDSVICHSRSRCSGESVQHSLSPMVAEIGVVMKRLCAFAGQKRVNSAETDGTRRH